MDNFSGESEFIESLDFLSPPVNRIHSSKQTSGNSYCTDANNVHLLRGFRNKLARRSPYPSKHAKTNFSESSTSLVLKKTSERQILGQCSIISFASLPDQPEIENGSGIKSDKIPNTFEKPLIKVTVIPKTDQLKAAKLLRRRRYIPKIVQSTASNQENSIKTKNLYLIVAGRRREKIYEIKTTGSAKLSTDHDSHSKYEEIPITELTNFKQLIQSLNMDKKKKKDKVAPAAVEHSEVRGHICECLPNYESTNVPEEVPKKSHVRIFGRLGLSEDDKYVLRYGASVNDKQVMSDVAQLTTDFSPAIAKTSYGIAEKGPEYRQTSCLQAAHDYDLDMEKTADADIISKESQGTQVNFNVGFATTASVKEKHATVSDKKVQCGCGPNISDHNTLKDCQSPLVIISVYPKQSPEDIMKSDQSAGVNAQSWSPPAGIGTYMSKQIIKNEKIHNNVETRRSFKNTLMSRSTSPVRKVSKPKVVDDLLKVQVTARRSPDRQKALRAIKEKIREKDKLRQDGSSRKLPSKVNMTNATQVSRNLHNLTVSNATQVSKRNQRLCDVSILTQDLIRNHQLNNTANGTYVSGTKDNTVSNGTQYVYGADILTATNACQCEVAVDSLQKPIPHTKQPRAKAMQHLRSRVSKWTQSPKTTQILLNNATQASKNVPLTISNGTQISKTQQNFQIQARMSKVPGSFTAKPAQVFKSEQTPKPISKPQANTGTNTDHAKTKKALVDSYTKKLTEKMNQRDYIPTKYTNSKVTINIDGDKEYYDVLFNQNKVSTDLTIRKKMKDVGSQKCVEPTLESLLCLSECEAERGELISGNKSPTKPPSILLQDNPSDDEIQLMKHVSRLTIRDSLEICHRREDKSNNNNIKNTQTCFMTHIADSDPKATEFLAYKVKTDTLKIRVIFEYEFRRGTSVAETARNINAVFGEDTTNEHTVRFWFRRFDNGNFHLKKREPRGRQASKVNNDESNMVEADPYQTSKKLSAWLDVSIPTTLTHLHQSAPIKHFTGDDCSLYDPVQRDKQIRELLGVDKVKPYYANVHQVKKKF